MESVSTRLDDETAHAVRETAAERDVSVAEVLRALIEKGREYDQLEAERDDLRRQLQAANRHQRDVGELVEYVNEERTLSRKKHNASAAQRIKWLLFGGDDDEE